MPYYDRNTVNHLRSDKEINERMLAEREKEQRELQRELRELIRSTNHAGLSSYEIEELTNRIISFSNVQIENLSEEMQAAIGRQNIQFMREINHLRDNVDFMNGRIEDLADRVDDLNTQFRQAIDQIVNEARRKEERAEAYNIQLRLLLGQINLLHPDKLTPGEREIISSSLVDVDSDISSGDYEAAIGLAQSKIPDATNLYSRLEVLNQEYEELVAWLRARIKALDERFENLQKPEKNTFPIKFGNENTEFDGEINYWSSNILQELINYYEELSRRISNVYEVDYDIEGLRDACSRIMRLEEDLQACISLSHSEYFEYVCLSSWARRLHDVMTYDNSWSHHREESGFIDKDKRKPYHLVYDDGAGNVASVVIYQDRPERGKRREKKEGKIRYIPVLANVPRFSFDVYNVINNDNAVAAHTKRGLARRYKERLEIRSEIELERQLVNHNPDHVSGKQSEEYIQSISLEADKPRIKRVDQVRNQLDLKMPTEANNQN